MTKKHILIEATIVILISLKNRTLFTIKLLSDNCVLLFNEGHAMRLKVNQNTIDQVQPVQLTLKGFLKLKDLIE